MSDIASYTRYFPTGMRVGIGIPFSNARVFKDWAIILELMDDLATVQLSRDILPEDVILQYGQIVELRSGTGSSGYCCRAIVVSEKGAPQLLLRLIGEVVSDELREFYRIDAYLPIKYYVSPEQNIDTLFKQWEKRRNLRLKNMNIETDGKWHSSTSVTNSDLKSLKGRHVEKNSTKVGDAEIKDDMPPLAANISGGGLRIITHKYIEPGDYLLLDIVVHTPMRTIDVIGRVAFSNRNYAAGSDKEYYNTGVQFVYIDDRDRDAIINYITTVQLRRIQQMREQYLSKGGLNDAAYLQVIGSTLSRRTKLIISVLFGLLIIANLIYWFHFRPLSKSEFERSFEEGVEKYRSQQPKLR